MDGSEFEFEILCPVCKNNTVKIKTSLSKFECNKCKNRCIVCLCSTEKTHGNCDKLYGNCIS